MLFIGYENCGTCRRARQWLMSQGLEFCSRPIREEPPTMGELDQWQQLSGMELKKFFNTSGQLYKAMRLKDRLPSMTREEQLRLLASDGMLVRRPLLIDGDRVLVGFREEEWRSLLAGREGVQ